LWVVVGCKGKRRRAREDGRVRDGGSGGVQDGGPGHLEYTPDGAPWLWSSRHSAGYLCPLCHLSSQASASTPPRAMKAKAQRREVTSTGCPVSPYIGPVTQVSHLPGSRQESAF
jgi:hypothetical protein